MGITVLFGHGENESFRKGFVKLKGFFKTTKSVVDMAVSELPNFTSRVIKNVIICQIFLTLFEFRISMAELVGVCSKI